MTRSSLALLCPLLFCLTGACGDDDKPAMTPDAAGDGAAPNTMSVGNPATPGADGGLGPRPPERDGATPNIDSATPLPPPVNAPDGAPADGGSALPSEASTPGCGSCAAHELCDPSLARCVDKWAPFALDCNSLPRDGVCQGGPREVILAVNDFGAIVALDPVDGHYLKTLRREQAGLDDQRYRLATQGPDQCIWALARDPSAVESGESEALQKRAIERLNPDGSFRDHVIPKGKFFRDRADRLLDARTLSFTRDHVYVSADGRVARYTLGGEYVDEVWPFASDSLLVMRDGSLVLDRQGVTLARGSEQRSLLADVSSWQLWYAGKGELLVAADDQSNKLHRLNLETGVDTPLTLSEYVPLHGVAGLKNGTYLTAAYDDDVQLALADPGSLPPGNLTTHEFPLSLPAQLGRACLPEAVLRPEPEDPAASTCGAPAGTRLVDENFDQGAIENNGYHGWTLPAPGDYEVTLEQGALRLYGASNFTTPPYLRFEQPLQPRYVGFRLKVRVVDEAPSASVILQDLENGEAALSWLEVQADRLRASFSTGSAKVIADSWLQVELRDLDWTNLTYDLYVDCKRVADDVPFGRGAKALDRIVLANSYSEDVTYLDDLVIVE